MNRNLTPLFSILLLIVVSVAMSPLLRLIGISNPWILVFVSLIWQVPVFLFTFRTPISWAYRGVFVMPVVAYAITAVVDMRYYNPYFWRDASPHIVFMLVWLPCLVTTVLA